MGDWLTPQIVGSVLSLLNLGLWWLTSKNVKRIEVATNSMKDALVEATRVAAEAKGIAQGRRDVHEEQAQSKS